MLTGQRNLAVKGHDERSRAVFGLVLDERNVGLGTLALRHHS